MVSIKQVCNSMESFRKGSTIVGPTCYANLTYKVYILILLYNNCQTRRTLFKVNRKESFDCPKPLQILYQISKLFLNKNVLNNEYPFSKKMTFNLGNPKQAVLCFALVSLSFKISNKQPFTQPVVYENKLSRR